MGVAPICVLWALLGFTSYRSAVYVHHSNLKFLVSNSWEKLGSVIEVYKNTKTAVLALKCRWQCNFDP